MKNTREFKEIPLKLIKPEWNSRLATLIFELEELRTKRIFSVGVPPYIFFQLKDIFHILESLGSARIEGNRTTLAEFVEKKIQGKTRTDESSREIDNIENALQFLHKTIKEDTEISRAILSEVHKIITKDLTPPPEGEGSARPGELRNVNPEITGSSVVLPEYLQVPNYFDELLSFVNQKTEKANDLLVMALAHHRFAWIHPFDNGNGRLVRLLTYAMLIKQGFQVKTGSILNPTAMFCMDRQKYYDMLAGADTGEQEKTIAWCEYVFSGLKAEIEKIDKLLDQNYLINSILLPVFSFSLENKWITDREYKILTFIISQKDMQVKAGDLEKVLNEDSSVQRSRIISKLKEKKMVMPLKENGRIYTVAFANNYLLRGIVEILSKEGFVANLDKKP